MSDVTHLLGAIEQGDPGAASQLVPLVYDELRQLARQRLTQEKPGQTLDATGLVHEAYLRLVDVHKAQHWNRTCGIDKSERDSSAAPWHCPIPPCGYLSFQL